MHNSLNNLISIKNEIYQINKQTKVIVVSKTFPMERAVEAINLIGNRGVIGKVVLTNG